MNTKISCSELKQLADQKAIVVIDVMTPEDYESGHIPGAHNACVYEMAFLERIAESSANRETALAVYDATGTSLAAENARGKLLDAGFRLVLVLSGGLAAWRSDGFPIEGTNPGGIPPPSVRDGSYVIDAKTGRLEWIGRNAGKRHNGAISVAGGELIVRNGLPTMGRVQLDMTSIQDFDLQDEGWRSLLIRHLKSDDFFDTERFPTAQFEMTGWEPLAGATAGASNGIAAGALTIKDATQPVRIPADISAEADGSIKAHAAFDIDRTLWNVQYGSGKLFERLGMHLVHDLISLELFVTAYFGDKLPGVPGGLRNPG
jgi:rhodanese-related sulfurtransferase